MNPYTLLGALDRALKHVTTEPGTDAPETSPVRVAELEGRQVVIISGEHSAQTAIAEALGRAAPDALGRHDLLRVLTEAEALPRVEARDPLLDLSLNFPVFVDSAPVKKNRAQDRAAGQRGKRKK